MAQVASGGLQWLDLCGPSPACGRPPGRPGPRMPLQVQATTLGMAPCRPPRRPCSRSGACGNSAKPQQKALARPQSAPGRRLQSARSSSHERDQACKAEAVPKKAAEVRKAIQTPTPAVTVTKTCPAAAPDVTRRRQVRPPSAKGTKHRRVVDDDLDSIIYEDVEEVPEDVSRHWESFCDIAEGAVAPSGSPKARCGTGDQASGQGGLRALPVGGGSTSTQALAAAAVACCPPSTRPRPTSAALGGRSAAARGGACRSGPRAVSAGALSRSLEIRASVEDLRSSVEGLDLGALAFAPPSMATTPVAEALPDACDPCLEMTDLLEPSIAGEDLPSTPGCRKERRALGNPARPPKPRLK
uniref:Uncharacterized protein n=1 Tax=Alexandrium monilatum TaxID=311494 RepID=A0A7S4QNI9_9DINO